ncbi:MAG TPA: MMPL family transporter, partial [Streptomyces sp.]
MATFLYKLGRFAFRRRRYVVLIWVALLALAGVGAATAPSAPTDNFTVPGTEAQHAFDLLHERFPGSNADGATARMVFKAPGGQKITAGPNKAAVERVVEELKHTPQKATVADPFSGGGDAVSKDGTTAYASVSYTAKSTEITDATHTALEKAAKDGRAAGLTVETGGTALQATPETGNSEVIGIGIAAVVLMITFSSLVAAGLPLLTAIMGVGIGIASITALASTLGLSSTSSTLASMIGLAVGIDYALFIVSRHRHELMEGRDGEDAAGRAVGTAGSAVVFAGLTVLIALAGLAVVNIPMLTKMGLAAAATVAIAVLIALTLIPALLGFAGPKVLTRKVRKGRAAATDKPNMGTRWARMVVRRRVPFLLAGVVALGLAAIPMSKMELGLPDDGSQPVSTTQRRAYDMLSDGFGSGFNGPLMIVVDVAHSDNPKAAADKVKSTIAAFPDVKTVHAPAFNKAGDTATLTVVPSSKPSSTTTEDLVHVIRGHSADFTGSTGAKVLVTGTTAMNIDVSQKLNDAL